MQYLETTLESEKNYRKQKTGKLFDESTLITLSYLRNLYSSNRM